MEATKECFFYEMEDRDEISLSAMIDIPGKCFMEALEIFHQMQRQKIRPRKFGIHSLLSANACANLGALVYL